MEQSLCHHGVSHGNPLPVSKWDATNQNKAEVLSVSNGVRIIPRNEKKEQSKSSQRKVTNARSLQLTNLISQHLHPSFFFFFLFVFVFQSLLAPQTQEACGGEAYMAACDAGATVCGSMVRALFLPHMGLSCWVKSDESHFNSSKSCWYKNGNAITVNTWERTQPLT